MFDENYILRHMSSVVFTTKYETEMTKNEINATEMSEICEIKSLCFMLEFLKRGISVRLLFMQIYII